jgi:Ca2+-binding RTX toxin-like protein
MTTQYKYIFGDAGDNILIGGEKDDAIFGYGGNDYLQGNGGNDYLYGDQDIDTLVGDAGNDILMGGVGNDTLIGGADADSFTFFSLWEGIDTIKDFNWVEEDKIHIYASGFGATSIDQFNFDDSTGALSFQGTQFAILQPGSEFIPSLDIVLF